MAARIDAVGGGTVVGTGAVMAKKKSKPAGPAKPSGASDDFIRVRMTGAFKQWLEEYAEFRNLTVADTVTQALIEDAKSNGFIKSAPKRTPPR
jgi:hypothetical protein